MLGSENKDMKNEFIEDASFFFKKASELIVNRETLSKLDVVEGILFFSLGMERVLKGLLYNINPIYVLKSQDFKNSVSIFYSERLLPNFKQNQEIAKSPDADVLTFKLSLLRAKSISKITESNTALLFALSNYRDIIAHNQLSLLEVDKAKTLLLRDFYKLIRDYCGELNLPASPFMGSFEIKLASISSEHQESIEEKVKIKLESHLKRWEQLKNVPGFIEKMGSRTKSVQESSYKSRDSFSEIAECPACHNDSLISIEIDFDYSEGQVTPIGAFVSSLKCLFCKLVIEDYDEMDYLNLNDLLIGDYEDVL